MDKYGIDRPDLRFGLQLFNVTSVVANSSFGVFKNAIGSGGQVKGVLYPGGASLARSEIDELTEFVKQYGAKGLGVDRRDRCADVEWQSGRRSSCASQIAKFLSAEELRGIVARQWGTVWAI